MINLKLLVDRGKMKLKKKKKEGEGDFIWE